MRNMIREEYDMRGDKEKEMGTLDEERMKALLKEGVLGMGAQNLTTKERKQEIVERLEQKAEDLEEDV